MGWVGWVGGVGRGCVGVCRWGVGGKIPRPQARSKTTNHTTRTRRMRPAGSRPPTCAVCGVVWGVCGGVRGGCGGVRVCGGGVRCGGKRCVYVWTRPTCRGQYIERVIGENESNQTTGRPSMSRAGSPSQAGNKRRPATFVPARLSARRPELNVHAREQTAAGARSRWQVITALGPKSNYEYSEPNRGATRTQNVQAPTAVVSKRCQRVCGKARVSKSTGTKMGQHTRRVQRVKAMPTNAG